MSKTADFLDKLKNNRIVLNYGRMWTYVRRVWFRALLSMLICIPIGSLDAVIALALKPYMDVVMVGNSDFTFGSLDLRQPIVIPILIILFTSLQGGLKYLSAYLNTWVGNKISNGLKLDLFKKLLTFQTSYFDKRKSGDVIFQFNNMAESCCNGLLANLSTFAQRIFSSISLVAVLFYNSWQLAIVAVIVLGCAIAPVAQLRKKVKSVFSKAVIADSAIITEYNEVFAGNKTITSYNLQKREKEKFDNILRNIFTLRIKMVQRTEWLSPMMHIIVSIGIAIAIGFGSHLIVSKTITPGNFVSFITALILLYNPVKSISANFNAVVMSFISIEMVFKNLEAKPEIVDKPDARIMPREHNEISFNNIKFGYTKKVPVIKDISFKVKKGETFAFVGNSGGGKTTIVNLLPRFYDIKSGSITIDGTDIKDFTLHSLRENISVVFQDNFLFSGTIRENILLGNENATEEQVNNAVKMACLEDFITSLKDGLDTVIGERGVLLSGGQKQRVAIARAFLKDAPIIILDEATSALDNKSEAVVQRAIDNLMQDKTVFVIAHRLSTIQNADQIAVVNEGQLVELGSHEELMQIENGAYKLLYDMQFKRQEQPVEV